MTVFEKIKNMNLDECAAILNKIQSDYDFINNFYCGYLCSDSSKNECFNYPESCPLNGEPVFGCKVFLNTDYDEIRRILNG